MKTEYNIKDTVWIHMGERKLTRGRVVEIIDLEHLNEGIDPDYELYVIQVQTGIEPVYEVRDFSQISPDAHGPIAVFRREGLVGANRFLKKVGLPIPQFEEWNENNAQSSEIHGGITAKNSDNKDHVANAPARARPKKKRFHRGKPKKSA
jgi:hypothetical protein